MGTREPWEVFELGRAMVGCVFGKMSLASILEGIKLEAPNPGEQLGWERGICSRVGLWKGKGVRAGEELRKLSERTLKLAGCRGG